MGSGLLRRIPRDLKKSWARYLALMVLIIASMYIVVSVVGMTEVTIQGTAKKIEENRIQDGQFQTFEKLTDKQVNEISEMGVITEELFYVDISNGEKTIRVGKIRKNIDLIDLDEGTLPVKEDEIVLMNLYCDKNGLSLGDQIVIADKTFTISGIGSVPDYNLPLKNMSDMTSDPNRFGVGFVCDASYEQIVNSDNVGSEVYVYAYRLCGATASALKEKLKTFDYDYESSDNVYLKEMIDKKLEDKYSFEDGLEELGAGIDELKDGASELYDGAGELYDGITELKDSVPDLADGVDKLSEGADDLYDGVSSYTSAVDSAKKGAEDLADGAESVASGAGNLSEGADALAEGAAAMAAEPNVLVAGTKNLADGAGTLEEGTADLAKGAEALSDGLGEISRNSGDLRSGASDLCDGIDELSEGVAELSDGVDELYDGSEELKGGTEELCDGVKELSDGYKEFRDSTEEFLDDAFEVDISLLEEFTENKDNPRIASDAASDVMIKKSIGLFAGAVILALVAYVISVFIGNQIREESSVIGTLFALGIRKGEIAMHYIILPVILTFVAGLIGMMLGFSSVGVDFQMQDIYEYYSVPVFESIRPLYLIIYCCVVPPVIAAVVNYLVINGKLSSTALSLMRNEDSQRIKGNERASKEKKNFLDDFKSRQIRRERRSIAAVVVGMVISLVLLLMGVSCYVLCNNVKQHNIRDASCEYTYVLKYPSDDIPEGAEECYAKILKHTYLDYTLDVTLYGIVDNSSFFEAKPSKCANKVVIGNGVATKYSLTKGDMLILTDSSEDKNYAFEIEDVVDYSIGLTVFMNIDSARDLFGAEDDEYNVLFSHSKLDIEDGRVMSVTTSDEIIDTAGIFVDQMMSLVIIMISISVLIFVTVMYLMINVMIRRASVSIALVKIFGYRSGELRRIFMDGNFIAVAVSALAGIPLCKIFVDRIYPLFIANTAMENDITYPWWLWIFLFAAVMTVYFLISTMLMGKIKRIEPAEILKNRE